MKSGILFLAAVLSIPFPAVRAVAEPVAPVAGGKGGMSVTREPLPVDQIIVKYRAPVSPGSPSAAGTAASMGRLSAAAGVSLGYFRPMSGEAHVLRLPQRLGIGRVLDICDRLAAMPEVEYAEPDYILLPAGNSADGALAVPDDPRYKNQWHLFAPGANHYGVNAPPAWDLTTGSTGVYIAVLDGGILNHADLSGRWIGGYDFITDPARANDGDGRDDSPLDPGDWVAANECAPGAWAHDSSWHGTHVAGTIGAASNNGIGVSGLNWVSKLVPLRVTGKCGGASSDIIDAMRWSAGLAVSGVPVNPYPARVVNMSIGEYSGRGCPVSFQNAIDDLVAAGSVPVAAAGNSSQDVAGFSPANCTGVITVAATNRDGGRAYYSNYGSMVEIAAPGGEINIYNTPGVLSTLNGGTTSPGSDTYGYSQGTSMATPHVSGVASLMLSVNGTLTPMQVTNILRNTATPFPSGSNCSPSTCGSGIVNASAAVATAQSYNGLPIVTSTEPADGVSGVPFSGPLKAVFSKPMNGATITSWTFTLNNGVTGSVAYDPATYTASFSPDPPGLSHNTAYTATITSGVADAAGNHMAEPKVWSFTTGGPNPFANGDFEGGATGWTQSSTGGWDLVFSNGLHSHGGSGYAWLGGYNGGTDTLYRDVVIPAGATVANARFWYRIATKDGTTAALDTLALTIRNPATNAVLATLASKSNRDATDVWTQSPPYDLTGHRGQTVRLAFAATTNSSNPTDFFIDDVTLDMTVPMRSLTVNFPGNGSGVVTISPGNIVCNTTYFRQFEEGIALSLVGAPQDYTDFNGWTGDCSGALCSLTMNGNRTVAANFALDTVHKARIGSDYFPTLPAAYGSTVGSTIMAWGTHFAESLTCDRVKDVTIDGGYNDAYSAKSGHTLLQGPLTITSGSLTVRELTIR